MPPEERDLAGTVTSAHPHFSAESRRDDWETPYSLFEVCNHHWDFKLDAAASHGNARCDDYYTKERSGLSRPWKTWTWCNPPYSDILPWYEKAHCEALEGHSSVLLTFAKTDTRAFHKYALQATEVIFLQGRVSFVHPLTKGPMDPAPHPSILVVFDAKRLGDPVMKTMKANPEMSLDLPFVTKE